jgi:hypothetical protein
VPTDVQPPELAALLDYAERPRVGDWSLRAALTRYAQPQPQGVSDVLDNVRRMEFALGSYRDAIESEGPELWKTVHAADATQTGDRLVGMLQAMVELDRLGDVLAAWADDTTRERPDETVGAVTAEVARRLDELGIPHEERQPPSRSRG